MDEIILPDKIAIIALRGMTIFPEQTIHFDIGRRKSALALEHVMKHEQYLLLVPQKDINVDDPGFSDLYPIGCVVSVKQIVRAQGDNIRILVSGICRARLKRLTQTAPYLQGEADPIESIPSNDDITTQALIRDATQLYGMYLDYGETPTPGNRYRIVSSKDCGYVADGIAQNCGFDYTDKAKLLCQLNPVRRLEQTIRLLDREIQMQQIESDIQERTRSMIDQEQKDYYLREQIKAIREELGESDEHTEFAEYESKIYQLALGEESETKLLKDLQRLKKQPFGSADASVLRNYLDTVLDIPWHKTTKERVDIAAAQKVLDRDHYGLDKVKKRIIESLAVRKMAPNMPPQIICLVGPPGVGKTSIAYSIAKSLNRKMARISLGGVRDEAEIRGHRKTYVGAMPGRIITALIQAGSCNPLLLLDEVDKMGSDYRGDPSAALLEVLDAEQNATYRDHFVEIPVDLSDVMFITTANTTDTIPRPLLDRMEIIELGSYTDEEKVMIASRHLIPKQMEKHGLRKAQMRITEDALREIIACYTRESGVRKLERCIAEICRKVDVQLLGDTPPSKVLITGAKLKEYLGAPKYLPDRLPGDDQVGLVTGLAWTAVGGETLEVEVNVMPGTGKLERTGNLGDVMKESVHAAMSYIRANTELLGIEEDFYKTKDIHVHFPEGAVPKDGPSAGITVCTALVSALTGVSVRRDVAMTGEISIRGRVLPIGGLKEKTMAALRHGIRTVIIPQENERDLDEIDPIVRKSLNFITAKTVDTVLAAALNQPINPVSSFSIPAEVVRKSHKPGIRQ